MSNSIERTASAAPPGANAEPCSWFELSAFAGIGLAGAVALAGLLRSDPISPIGLLALYLMTLLGLGSVVFVSRRRGRDCTIPLLALLAATCLGPVAAFGALGLALGDRRRAGPGPLLVAWYDRIATAAAVGPDERLCESVSTGRTLNLTGPMPNSFPSLMDHGPIADRQVILGHIARNFHPIYIETLAAALASPEPSVRVQAAAVAAHLAPRLRQRLVDALADSRQTGLDPLQCLRLVDELGALAGSGLLDANERLRAEAEARRLGDTVMGAAEAGRFDARMLARRIEFAEVEPTLERILLERGRIAALRQLRRRRRLALHHPEARLRKLRPSAPREAAA